MTGFAEFIKTLTDMELVQLQREARDCNDTESLNLILAELGNRVKSGEEKTE